ncbi:MAG: lipoprotein [Gammaproteobacteria bacterium]|nr:lipoprotein [Gammaproteobacteria bacterium]
MKLNLCAILICLCTMLAGCGQMGELYLPNEEPVEEEAK